MNADVLDEVDTGELSDRAVKWMESDPMTRHLVTISLLEAGRLLGIGRTRCYELNRAGEFPVRVREIAGQLRVRLVDIEAFLDS